jgi:hypothetical protein
MDWFWRLREALPEFYPEDQPKDIVGYLQGSTDAQVWRTMTKKGREPMMILGSAEPTPEEWSAAGVAHRNAIHTIRFDDLWGFLITYGGFIMRPWGRVSGLTPDLYRNYGLTIEQFKANRPGQ